MVYRSLVACLFAALFFGASTLQAGEHDHHSYLGKTPPELISETAHWMGSGPPLSLAKLKGKVVWLHFNF